MALLAGSYIRFLFFTYILLTATLQASPVEKTVSGVLAPVDDPFYIPPVGYEAQPPGSILRNRTVKALSIQGLIPLKLKQVHQLLYRTTDSLGNPEATVSTIAVPVNANFSRLLSYQSIEDASWINCAPSYVIQEGGNPLDSGLQGIETFLIVAMLEKGWVVSLPDYEGPKAVFTSGVQAGQATLDAVRAALQSESITGISPNAEYQMYGYSGGAVASQWAAELQPEYAPELNFIGASIGGQQPNLTTTVLAINKGIYSGMGLSGIMGLTSGYPDLKEMIDEEMVESKASTLQNTLSQCLNQNINSALYKDIFSFFKSGEAILQNPILLNVINETGVNGLRGTPKFPLHMYKVVGDEISPIADTDKLVDKLCSQGANIQYIREAIGQHIPECVTGFPGAISFLNDRFNGVPASTGCAINNITSGVLEPGALEIFGELVYDGLKAVLQFPIGLLSSTSG